MIFMLSILYFTKLPLNPYFRIHRCPVFWAWEALFIRPNYKYSLAAWAISIFASMKVRHIAEFWIVNYNWHRYSCLSSIFFCTFPQCCKQIIHIFYASKALSQPCPLSTQFYYEDYTVNSHSYLHSYYYSCSTIIIVFIRTVHIYSSSIDAIYS